MMWIQTALPFFIKRIKSALGSHSYSSAGFSCLSVVKFHQHLQYDNAANLLSKVERFMWAVLALDLSWFGLCLIILALTTLGGKKNPPTSLQDICHGTTCCCRNNHVNLLRQDKFTADRLWQAGPRHYLGPGEREARCTKQGGARERGVCASYILASTGERRHRFDGALALD